MPRYLPCFFFLLATCALAAQEITFLKLSSANQWEASYGDLGPQAQISQNKVVAVMGGLNDWDGANNYFNFFGSKVIIERKDIASNGNTHLVLRREDGKNFYGLYPILNAEIVPASSRDLDLFNTARKP
ncbi:hypothetical protein [Maribacter sp. 2307ULW6-5]|uniref:hypothetical protein n=1 Tax=Maribacter sp. 2307ULW6-5 TaxID=3386275 RepID=UPI0039BD6A09